MCCQVPTWLERQGDRNFLCCRGQWSMGQVEEQQEGTDFIGCSGKSLGEKCTGECQTYKGFRGDPKVLTCEVEGIEGKMSGDKPTCNIRRLYDGTKCVFPVKYKEEIIDDCVQYNKEDGTSAEWCFTNPAIGTVGDC